MEGFNKVIGYDAIKKELLQILDMIKNRDIYDRLGARLPHGILLYGKPGIGKTITAKCFVQESGLKSYTLRKNKSVGNFVEEITNTFLEAKKSAPSIIFIDDMDKFANEDFEHKDAEEYVAIQSGIDDVSDCEVFVFATANDINKLPESLLRAGRFDKKICMRNPSSKDAKEIIEYYLSQKAVDKDINMLDLSKMFTYSSCAELESIINEAAISAGNSRKEFIEMDDLIEAILRDKYNSPDDLTFFSKEEIQKIALHEAGHVVVSENFVDGSVGLASIRQKGRHDTGGFVHRCEELMNQMQEICVRLAGKIATELYFPNPNLDGCSYDIEGAADVLRKEITSNGILGVGMVEINNRGLESSESFISRSESVVCAELERLLSKTREIILMNKDFLEKIQKELEEKETLLYSDIQRVKNSCKIVNVPI